MLHTLLDFILGAALQVRPFCQKNCWKYRYACLETKTELKGFPSTPGCTCPTSYTTLDVSWQAGVHRRLQQMYTHDTKRKERHTSGCTSAAKSLKLPSSRPVPGVPGQELPDNSRDRPRVTALPANAAACCRLLCARTLRAAATVAGSVLPRANCGSCKPSMKGRYVCSENQSKK
jgi:hypothetical protein